MRKLVFGATFLGAGLAVRAAMASSAAIRPVLGILAVLLGLALVGLVIVLPPLLLSAALRRFFNRQELELDEPEERLLLLPGALESRPSPLTAKR